MSNATRPANGTQRIAIDRFEFPGLHDRPAACRLVIVRGVGRGGRTVVVAASELPDNPGASVTNAAELLAGAVCTTYQIHPSDLWWIEHYQPEPGRLSADWDHVTFGGVAVDVLAQDGGDEGPSRAYRFGDPDWRPMTADDWIALGIGPDTILHGF